VVNREAHDSGIKFIFEMKSTVQTINTLAKEFLTHNRIAVAGASGKTHNVGNYIYSTLRSKGYSVFAINPNAERIEGDTCYPDLYSLPKPVDGVVITARPSVSEQIVRQCVDLGIKFVWMHNMQGTRWQSAGVPKSGTSVSPEAVRLCREHGITVIPGSCPMQFIGDFGHRCMGWVLRAVGAMRA